MKLFHDDDCGELLDQTGMCPKCKFYPDMQSTSFKEVSDAEYRSGKSQGQTYLGKYRTPL